MMAMRTGWIPEIHHHFEGRKPFPTVRLHHYTTFISHLISLLIPYCRHRHPYLSGTAKFCAPTWELRTHVELEWFHVKSKVMEKKWKIGFGQLTCGGRKISASVGGPATMVPRGDHAPWHGWTEFSSAPTSTGRSFERARGRIHVPVIGPIGGSAIPTDRGRGVTGGDGRARCGTWRGWHGHRACWQARESRVRIGRIVVCVVRKPKGKKAQKKGRLRLIW